MNDLFIRLERRIFLVFKVHTARTLGGCAGLIREIKACTSGKRVAYCSELDSLKHGGNTTGALVISVESNIRIYKVARAEGLPYLQCLGIGLCRLCSYQFRAVLALCSDID